MAGKELMKPLRPHPVTTEIIYTDEELEWLKAIQDYKRRTGRMWPTWSEILALAKSLGYRKVIQSEKKAEEG